MALLPLRKIQFRNYLSKKLVFLYTQVPRVTVDWAKLKFTKTTQTRLTPAGVGDVAVHQVNTGYYRKVGSN